MMMEMFRRSDGLPATLSGNSGRFTATFARVLLTLDGITSGITTKVNGNSAPDQSPDTSVKQMIGTHVWVADSLAM